MRQQHDRQIKSVSAHALQAWSRAFVFVTVFVLFSCTDGRYDALLRQADSLLTVKPDSAWTLLSAVDSADIARQSRSTQMRYQLLRAEAQNKAYVPFTTDSVLRRVVRYYDRHGSANQQLKARYILGCAYRDMHEAPLAIITWEEAVDRADTLSHDCDYSTLYRVYGQMAELFMRQRLPKKQLKALKKYCDYALLAGDTSVSLHGRLLANSAYYSLLDTTAIYMNSEAVRQEYLKLGQAEEAATVYPTPIHVAVETHQYDRARRMMDIYEHESGLFDEQGNLLDRTRIQHLYYKGLYYLGIQQTDSAELQFRKLLADSIHFIDACRGLFKLYSFLHDADSAYKYSQLYEESLEQYIDNLNSEAVIQAKALYDYQRNEQIALKKQKQLSALRKGIATGTLISLIIIAIIYINIRKKRSAKENEIRELMNNYALGEMARKRMEEELTLLNNNLRTTDESRLLLMKKNKELEMQLERLKEYELAARQQKTSDMEAMLMKEDIIHTLQQIHQPSTKHIHDDILRIPARVPTDEEWNALYETYRRYLPVSYDFIEKTLTKNTQEFKVALLTRIGFKNKAISSLLDTSSSRTSTIKEKLNEKLFRQKGSKRLIINLKQIDSFQKVNFR